MIIDVLIPSRGRAQFLANCLRSLGATASDKSRVVAHVGIDADDAMTVDDPAWRRAAEETGLTVDVMTAPRLPTLHHVYNALWRRTSGDVCLGFADDQTMATPGWDDAVRSGAAEFPDGLAAGLLSDAVQRGAPTYWVLPRPWVETIGYAMSELFPFWFADLWVAEVAMLCRRQFRVTAATQPQWPDGKGRTHRMGNLGFWAAVFAHTRPQRVAEAKKILGRIGAPIRPDLDAQAAELGRRHDNLLNPFTAMIMEIMASGDHERYAAELRTLEALDMLVRNK
jgi:hypothetical protein